MKARKSVRGKPRGARRSTAKKATAKRGTGTSRGKLNFAASELRAPDCKHFQGYKPCFPGSECLEECVDPTPRGVRILIINLEAMGNVLVTTALLPALKRKYPVSTITWITLGNAHRLLENNPYLDETVAWEPEAWLKLQARKFDLVMNIDKAVGSCALIMSLNATAKVGYGLDGNGVIVPLNRDAEYNYILGLNDHLKFRVNDKPNTQLLTEAMGLPYGGDEYILRLSEAEEAFSRNYRQQILANDTGPERSVVVGFNTGCSTLYPNKKMTVDQHVVLIEQLSRDPRVRILLLGGPEDTGRNREISLRVGAKAISTPTTEGIRRGLCYIHCCDLVVTGDSFGMHASIGLKKHVVVWFGLSCPQEIDLFGRGVKLVPEGLACAPCWKKECPYNLECVQMIDLDAIIAEVNRFVGGKLKG